MFLARSYTDFVLLGSTRDDALGEAFDKIGRVIGIPYPAGAGFDKLAADGFREACGNGECDAGACYKRFSSSEAYKNREERLPSPAIAKSLDFSFSGLKTASINLLHRYEQLGREFSRPIFAARFPYEAVEAVAGNVACALEENPSCPLVVSGGGAAASHLRARLAEVCRERGRQLFIPPVSLCGDNGAMVASQAYFEFCDRNFAGYDLNASASDFGM